MLNSDRKVDWGEKRERENTVRGQFASSDVSFDPFQLDANMNFYVSYRET